MVVAAIKTMDGEKINWAQYMQQRMFEEIDTKRTEEAQTIELYAAFYISIFCEEPPLPTIYLVQPPSPGSTPSPLSSPEKPEQEAAELRRLRLRVQNLQTMVDMKQDQLIKTGEALQECQTNTVKSLYELAQVTREMMNK